MYPLKNSHKSGEGLRFLSADEINTIANMLNGLRIDVDANLDHAEVIPPHQDGTDWVFRIPCAQNKIPTPPKTGDYVLTSQNGVLSWVELEEFTCPEEE
jgi:hypothetical protein